MIIANPIYDVVFKKMMENERVAKFFISTLLEQQIESIQVKPQEFTYINDLDIEDPLVEKYIKEKVRERLSINVFRLDFIATIKTEKGEYKKVLIEIQKARNYIDLMRFRKYLAEQYKKEDTINNEKVILPITTIYILGFKLPEIESSCIKVERNYRDLIDSKIIDTKSDFVEKLTHDSFVVQVQRITNRYQTKLDKLLSVFEQKNFTDETEITKQYTHESDIEEVKIMTDILHYSGTEPAEKSKIEAEQEAWRTLNAIFEGKEKLLQKALIKLNEKEKALKQKDDDLKQKNKVLKQKDDDLKQKNKVLKEKDDDLKQKNQDLLEKERINAELLKQLEELKRKINEK